MTDRDCANCKHHTDDGCSSWDCEYKPKDLISRADAIDAVRKIVPYVIDNDTGQWGILVNKANVVTELSALPSADAVHGEWIFNPTDAIDLMFAKPKCSKCGFESSDGGNFCPNCGARMKGGDTE